MLENGINNVKIIRVIFSLYYATWQLYTFWNMRRMKTVTTYFFVIYIILNYYINIYYIKRPIFWNNFSEN